jgi:ferrochelatase
MNEKEYEKTTLIFSAHGLPKKIVAQGDVYEKHIEKHIKILKKMLSQENMKFEKVTLAYQSKVGPMEWLTPSLEEKLKECKKSNVVIYPLAFTIDNSETDFELRIEYKEIAEELGIKEYSVCKCPNDSEIFVDTLENIYKGMK